MSFTNYDLLLTARQHRQELAKHAADFRLVRPSRRPRRAEGFAFGPPRGRPDAA